MNRLIHIFLKLLQLFIKNIKYGNGSTIPGHIALKLNKNILKWYTNKLNNGVILITGTNGKTTTSHLIKEGVVSFGKKVIFSSTGANLENGIVSSFIDSVPYFSKGNNDYGVFEVDELNLKILLNNIKPLSIVFLNLSRDQLDRYAELEVILNSWQTSLEKLTNTNIFIYKEDVLLNKLKLGKITYFSDEIKFNSNIKGKFNEINLNASYKVLERLFPKNHNKIIKVLEGFKPVFGRGEKFIYNNNEITFLLNKNPASFNENLKLIIDLSPTYPQEDNLVVVALNNNIADGKDVSWIYDVQVGLILELDKNISSWVCLGNRYIDIATRLKYAGVKEEKIVLIGSLIEYKSYLDSFEKKHIWVLPTYTSMLTMRSIFNESNLGKSIKA
jgi:lipid II isoglutaminyl synthase (glutamine-hydrolysing)